MPTKKLRVRKNLAPNEARADEIGIDPGQVGPESAGQSGDVQGLSRVARSSNESVEDLAASDQSYEASVIEGVEDAGMHPYKPVRVHTNEVVDDADEPDSESGEGIER